MVRLSSHITELKPRYDVVVIGSGYGGAVAASRLARTLRQDNAKLSVCLLERGRELQPGDYPDTLLGVLRETQVDGIRGRIGRRTGLYDFRLNRDINVLVGCGLGGTSLINANVVMQPRLGVFDGEWPGELQGGTNAELLAGFERAKEMLEPAVYPGGANARPGNVTGLWPELKKLTALERAASPLEGLSAERARIAVSFVTRVNDVGVQQRACVLCGDCVTGCNYAAKNTLIMNYLPDAWNHGAKLHCGVQVRWLEYLPGADAGHPWLVHFELLDAGWERFRPRELFVRAGTVIVAAGTLGSTEILLRSKARGLPMSDQVGMSFSGNGDVGVFGYDQDDDEVRGVGLGRRAQGSKAPVGPTITGLIDARGPEKHGMLIQEGAIPSALRNVARFFFPLWAPVMGRGRERAPQVRRWWRGVSSLLAGAYQGALARTQTYLVMSHERHEGMLALGGDRIRVVWPGAARGGWFQPIRARLKETIWRLGGTYVASPGWSRLLGRRLTTVHPLGGCPMADDAAHGVVNDRGQVFRSAAGKDVYPDLYICDGSVVPGSLGANPLLTITALAERTCKLLVEDRGWTSKDSVDAPATGNRPPRRLGIQFSERMKGYLRLDGEPEEADPYFQFTVTISSDDLERLVQDLSHKATLVGVAFAPQLSPRPLTITDGTFQLFAPDPDRVETREMVYEMTLTAVSGETFHLTGRKTIHDDPGTFDLWSDLSRLKFNLSGNRVGWGELRIGRMDVLRIIASARITNARTARERWRALRLFCVYYATSLYKQFGWLFGPVDVINPYARGRVQRSLALPEREMHRITTADHADIELLRYHGGDEGPVILAPGFGTSTYAFRLPTIRTNIAEYLFRHGYDVWLLDYRASERSAASRTQFTIDDIARYDYPAAVEHVCQTAGKDVQFIGHCVASVALMMSVLGGHLRTIGAPRVVANNGSRLPRVRSIICSQFFTHIDHPWINRLKAYLRTADVLHASGLFPDSTLNPDFTTESPFHSWIIDRFLHLYPTREHCRNPICRRNLFLYGEVYRHDQLNPATHDAIYDMFDRANLTTFKHLLAMIRAGHAVDSKGRDTYLTRENAEQRLGLPITLLQGAENGIFRPRGGERTLAWLRGNGAPTLQQHVREEGQELYRLVRVQDYGHMDLFIGRNAERDVYPLILLELRRGGQVAAMLSRLPRKSAKTLGST